MQSADLKRAGLKATLPRLRILEILEDSSDLHVTAEDVYGRLRAAENRLASRPCTGC